MIDVLLVAIGAALGAISRALLAWLCNPGAVPPRPPAGERVPDVPLRLGTLAANTLASGILGVVIASSAPVPHLLVAVGFCGGLSTVSTLATELDAMFRTNRAAALRYGATTLTCGFAAAWAGLTLAG